jgi:hypothetical protein
MLKKNVILTNKSLSSNPSTTKKKRKNMIEMSKLLQPLEKWAGRSLLTPKMKEEEEKQWGVNDYIRILY